MNGTNGNQSGFTDKALVPYPVILAATSQNAANAEKLPNKKPADIRYIGTALGTLTIHGKQTTVRFIVVTAEPVDKK